jgi:hypothetical protein
MPNGNNRRSSLVADENLRALGDALRRVHGLVAEGKFDDLLAAIDEAEAAAKRARPTEETPDRA